MDRNAQTSERPAVAAVLFLCLFAGQAGLIALSPVLADAARDLDVSTAAAGQLRTVAGIAAAVGALSLGRLAARTGLGPLLLAGTTLLALGSLGSAAAPGLGLLALAQVPLGLGAGIVTTAGTLAAAEWFAPEQRTRALSWALVGQPAAWIVGMPLAGVLGAVSWRYAWLALPLAAAAVAAAALLWTGASRRGSALAETTPRAPMRAALSDAAVSRWLGAELLANSAWAGTLVFSGALFVESYGASSALAGVVLAVAAAAYVAGNFSSRRLAGTGSGGTLAAFALVLAVLTVLLGTLRPSLAASAAIFSAAAFAAGGRTLVSSAFGLGLGPELRPAALGLRSASMQVGHFAGASVAGVALALGGYPLLGLAVGALFLAAAAVLVRPLPVLYRGVGRVATALVSTTRVLTEKGAIDMNHAHVLHSQMRQREPRHVVRRREELIRHRAEAERVSSERTRNAFRSAWHALRTGGATPAPAAPRSSPAVALRLATVHDEAGIRALASLESRALPKGDFVVAEVDGRIVAAHPLAGGETLADPFRAAAYLLPLLRVRAEQLAAAEGERRRGWAVRLASLARSG